MARKRTPPAAPPPDPPAQTPQQELTSEEKIDRIVVLILRGEWNTKAARRCARLWRSTPRAIAKFAERAQARVDLASPDREQELATARNRLEEIYKAAVKAQKLPAALRAVELQLKVMGALGPAARGGRSPRGEEVAPSGLPPELARLDPPPTRDEVVHFACTERPEDCQIENCRVHPRTPPAAEIH